MSTDDVDKERRRFLVASTTVIGGIGAVCGSIPFISSWAPSVRTKALGAPVQVDISKIEMGQKITVAWRGQPIFILHRTPAALTELDQDADQLRDPKSDESVQPLYAHNLYRSIKKDFLILTGICTHLGCVPLYKPDVGSVDASWKGGFFCPCHGSKYDFAGRVYKGVPAPLNLPIPPHYYLSDTILVIGEDQGAVKGGA